MVPPNAAIAALDKLNVVSRSQKWDGAWLLDLVAVWDISPMYNLPFVKVSLENIIHVCYFNSPLLRCQTRRVAWRSLRYMKSGNLVCKLLPAAKKHPCLKNAPNLITQPIFKFLLLSRIGIETCFIRVIAT